MTDMRLAKFEAKLMGYYAEDDKNTLKHKYKNKNMTINLSEYSRWV